MAIVACPNCGARNRVEDRGQGVRPFCGRCGTGLETPAAAAVPVEVTDATFREKVLSAGPRPVLLDCWAEWCGPCRMLAPTLDRLAAEAGGRYVIAKLNIDENPRVRQEFGISSIPTLLIFKDGALVDQLMGVQPKRVIEEKLRAYV